MAEYYSEKVNIDPLYWEELYNEAILDAKVLLSGKRNVAACFFCHAAIEKALKWKLALNNLLDPATDDIHSLNKLARKAGVLDVLDPNGRAAFNELSDLHNETSYPSDMVKYRAINEKGYTEMVVKNTIQALTLIEGLVAKERENNCEQ